MESRDPAVQDQYDVGSQADTSRLQDRETYSTRANLAGAVSVAVVRAVTGSVRMESILIEETVEFQDKSGT